MVQVHHDEGVANRIDPSGSFGSSILGIGGDEVIHCILDVMCAKAPCTVMQGAMHIHPTVAEFIPTMFADLKG